MFSIAGIDLVEQELLDHERTLLEILLQDKTTKKSIIWATDDYAELGEPYSFKKEILPELVTGEQDSLIQPRVEKALEHQTNRTRDKAEVFTPSWICNAQNNLVDEQWFGRKDVFNIQKEMSWKATADKEAGKARNLEKERRTNDFCCNRRKPALSNCGRWQQR